MEGMDMKEYVVTDESGRVIKQGDTITAFRGDTATFELVERGPEYNGTSKVYVTWHDDGYRDSYYAQVFGLTVKAVDE